ALRVGFVAVRVDDGPTDAGRGVQEERRLADPRLTAQQDQRSRDDAAAKDPVELGDRRRLARERWLSDVAERDRGGAGYRTRAAISGRCALHAHDRFYQAVPVAARAALPFPAEEELGAPLRDGSH